MKGTEKKSQWKGTEKKSQWKGTEKKSQWKGTEKKSQWKGTEKKSQWKGTEKKSQWKGTEKKEPMERYRKEGLYRQLPKNRKSIVGLLQEQIDKSKFAGRREVRLTLSSWSSICWT